MGEKHRITHTQTFFPESLILCVFGRSPGLRLVVYLPELKLSGFVETTSFIAYSCGYSSGVEPDSLLMFSDASK